jgi:hypothetical protein
MPKWGRNGVRTPEPTDTQRSPCIDRKTESNICLEQVPEGGPITLATSPAAPSRCGPGAAHSSVTFGSGNHRVVAGQLQEEPVRASAPHPRPPGRPPLVDRPGGHHPRGPACHPSRQVVPRFAPSVLGLFLPRDKQCRPALGTHLRTPCKIETAGERTFTKRCPASSYRAGPDRGMMVTSAPNDWERRWKPWWSGFWPACCTGGACCRCTNLAARTRPGPLQSPRKSGAPRRRKRAACDADRFDGAGAVGHRRRSTATFVTSTSKSLFASASASDLRLMIAITIGARPPSGQTIATSLAEP